MILRRDCGVRRAFVFAAGAGSNGHSAGVRFYLCVVNAEYETNATALVLAVTEGHSDTVLALLDAGADPDAREVDMTALMIAASNGYADIVRTLLDSGANVSAKTETGGTALGAALNAGHSDIVELLKVAGAQL